MKKQNNDTLVTTISKSSFKQHTLCDDSQLCCDGRIHIKFKDFDKEEIISGFHNKLVWLLTAMVNNYTYNLIEDNLSNDGVWSQYLTRFTLTSKEFSAIEDLMRKNFRKFKGFVFLKNYNFKNAMQQFGSTTFKCEADQVVEQVNNLFSYSLENLLFDDTIEIRLESKTDISSRLDKSYLKFDNKKQRKSKSREDKNSFCTLDLWN